MRKLKLELDALAVESFGTLPERDARRGTVEAFSHVCPATTLCIDTYNPATCVATCGSCPGNTCAFTCGATCNYTCDDPSCVTCLTNCGQESCVYVCP
jgi:hypothetical protein